MERYYKITQYCSTSLQSQFPWKSVTLDIVENQEASGETKMEWTERWLMQK